MKTLYENINAGEYTFYATKVIEYNSWRFMIKVEFSDSANYNKQTLMVMDARSGAFNTITDLRFVMDKMKCNYTSNLDVMSKSDKCKTYSEICNCFEDFITKVYRG